jgi:starch-binding outer membrane protein, SusD/RagB family
MGRCCSVGKSLSLSLSNQLIESGQFSLPSDLNAIFLKNSSEAIWQLMPVVANQNTKEGGTFILISNPSLVSLRTQLVNAFEAGDLRRTKWIGTYTSGSQTYYYANKYKERSTSSPVKEYYMIFRLGEQYLIRAEARALQNNVTGGVSDLNKIRNRAGLSSLTGLSQAQLLAAIQQERRFELLAEWGHRWFDLKRTNQADAVLSPLKGSNWQSTDALYPIPDLERQNNSNILQNAGY